MDDLVITNNAGRPAVQAAGRRLWWHRVIVKARTYAVLIMIAALGVFLTAESSSFLTPVNIINIFNQNAYLLIIASALTLVIISGAFDLSTGAMFAMSSVAAAWCARDPAFVQVFGTGAALAVGPLIGLLLGLVNGVAITSLRIHSFLATLATSLIFRGLAQELAGGNSIVLYGVPGVSWLGQGRIGLLYGAVVVMAVFCCAMAFLLHRTVYGRHVLAVGGNEEAAVLSGLHTRRIKIMAFSLVGLASGLAGSISLSRVLAAKAIDGAGYEFDAIAAVILGGTSIYGGAGSVWRSCAGVFLLALINNGFNILQVDPFFKDLTKGLIIIFAVALSASDRLRR
jgi:ribose transport system permease protein